MTNRDFLVRHDLLYIILLVLKKDLMWYEILKRVVYSTFVY